ncbi:LPS export ABC transporter permease LptG [candidate division KSB1 bacterium]|nr:LPS export ABC transporter permease LptG [candidate division KSB1 bacterium]
MRILDKYILRRFLGTLLFSLVAFSIIFIIVDLIGYMDKFIDRDVPRLVVAQYYFYYLPYIIVLSLPVAMLLASLFSIGQMTRYNEIVAMSASGVSLYRILRPLFIFGLICSVFILYSGEKFIPITNQKKINIYQTYVSKSKKKNKTRHNDVYAQISENQWMHVGYFDTRINTGFKVSVQRFEDNYSHINQRIDAAKIIWQDSTWALQNGVIRDFDRRTEIIEKFDKLQRPDFEFDVQEISNSQKKTEEMSYWELNRFIENIRRNGGNPNRWLVDLYMKISFPFANLIIILFGAPLASRKTRSGPAVSFGISLLICFLYFGIIKVGQALGHNGTLPPLLAAWIGNIIFGTAAIYILFKMRK